MSEFKEEEDKMEPKTPTSSIDLVNNQILKGTKNDWNDDWSTMTSRKTIFNDNFVSFWMRHSKHSRQFGRVIPNIHVTLDHFLSH